MIEIYSAKTGCLEKNKTDIVSKICLIPQLYFTKKIHLFSLKTIHIIEAKINKKKIKKKLILSLSMIYNLTISY